MLHILYSSSMRADSEITYSKDIVRIVAKKLDMPEEKVEHVLEFLIFYIKKLALLPNVFAIYLPEIGQMYLSAAYLKNAIINLSKKNRTEAEDEKLKVTKEKLKLLDSLLEPGYSPHKKRSKIRNNYFSLGKGLKELEGIQNEYDGRD